MQRRFARGGVCALAGSLVLAGLVSMQGTASATTGNGGNLVTLTPVKVANTVNGSGGLGSTAFAPSETRSIVLTGANGVPATGVEAVVLEAMASNSTTAGALDFYADDADNPDTVGLAYDIANAATNFVIAPVGDDGGIDVTNQSGNPDVSLTVEGYFTDSPSGVLPGGYQSVAPTRALDLSTTLLAAGATAQVQIGGQFGVPSGSKAVFASITASSPSSSYGALTVWSDDQSEPTPNTMHYDATNQSTGATVSLGSSGLVDVSNSGSFPVAVTVDIDGYFANGTSSSGSTYIPLQTHLFGSGTGGMTTVPAGQSVSVPVVGAVEDLPTDGGSMDAVAVNVTASGASAAGNLAVYADGTTPPDTADLSYTPSDTSSALAFSGTGSTGTVDVYNSGSSPVDVAVDLEGWFPDSNPGNAIDGSVGIQLSIEATVDPATETMTVDDLTGYATTYDSSGNETGATELSDVQGGVEDSTTDGDLRGQCYKKSGTNPHLTVYKPVSAYESGHSYTIQYFYADWSISDARQVFGEGDTFQMEGCSRGGGTTFNTYRETFDGTLQTVNRSSSYLIASAWPTHVVDHKLLSDLSFKVSKGPVEIGAETDLESHDSYSGGTGADSRYCVNKTHCVNSDWNVNRVNSYYFSGTTWRWEGAKNTYEGNNQHALWEFPENHGAFTVYGEPGLRAHCDRPFGIGCAEWK